jgi:predicted esterase
MKEEFENGDYAQLQEKKRTRLIMSIIGLVLIVVALSLILYFVFRPSSSDDIPELPFEVKKGETETQLIPKSGKYDYIFIFMHGLLGHPEDYIDIFNKKDGPIPDNFKIILPCASVEFVTRLNMNTTSWFDIRGKDGDVIREEDMEFSDMEKNADRIEKIIENEVKNINSNYSRVFLGGFSQGACMSFHIGLRFNYTLGGIVTFCGIPVTKTQIREGREDLNIFSILGTKDIYIPLDYARSQIGIILRNFTNLNVRTYEEEHAVTNNELEDVKKYINSLISS